MKNNIQKEIPEVKSVPLKIGDSFCHEDFFELEVKVLADGVYPFVKTGPATMILPWRYGGDQKIQVCLLRQNRVDAGIVTKICGGYNRGKDRDTAGLEHLNTKLGLAPGPHPVLWWRECLGVGPQYSFPISYGFLKEPTQVPVDLEQGMAPYWTSLESALNDWTKKQTDLFDDFSLAMLTILMVRYREL